MISNDNGDEFDAVRVYIDAIKLKVRRADSSSTDRTNFPEEEPLEIKKEKQGKAISL